MKLSAFKKRTLVAGGGGFLGAHLCKRLLEQGNDVICVDNFSSGSRANIEKLSELGKLTIIEQDVAQRISLNVDEIFNFTCSATNAKFQHPLQMLKANTEGIGNLLNLAVAKRAKIFHASSGEMYGNPDHQPYRHPAFIRTTLDDDASAEKLCLDYQRIYDTDVKIARVFDTYGPLMSDQNGQAVATFIIQALRNQPITLYGDGRDTHSLCYVDDVITGILALMNSPASLTGPISLGNPQVFTSLELAKKIIALTDSHSQIQYRPLLHEAFNKIRPNIDEADELLNWTPHVDLETGLLRTIEYFDELLRGEFAFTTSTPARYGVPL